MPQFERNSASLHYETAGEGEPLLLIAGIASDMASWGPLPPLLGGRRLITIDNRGSGQSKVEGPLAIEDMADDCAALLDHLGLEAADVAGHSLGGLIGLLLASRHPGKVRRLATMTSGTISPAARVLFRDMARLYFTMVPQDWFRLLYQWLFSAPFFADERNVAAAAEASTAYPHRQSPGDFARQVAAIDRLEPIDLSSVRAPVLALWAEHDLLAPKAAVESLHRSVPDLRLAGIGGAAHSVHWEKPAEVAAALNGFFALPKPRGRAVKPRPLF
jgi:aminoacrylate hydrolase